MDDVLSDESGMTDRLFVTYVELVKNLPRWRRIRAFPKSLAGDAHFFGYKTMWWKTESCWMRCVSSLDDVVKFPHQVDLSVETERTNSVTLACDFIRQEIDNMLDSHGQELLSMDMSRHICSFLSEEELVTGGRTSFDIRSIFMPGALHPPTELTKTWSLWERREF